MRARIWTLVILVLATAAYTGLLANVHAVPLRKPLASVPSVIGPWTGRSEAMEERVVKVVGVEDYLLRDYRDPSGFSASVYVGFYEQQKEGDQIHSPKHCLPGAGWRPVLNDVTELETPGFSKGKTRANRYVIGKGEDRQLVLYWYQSGGRAITNEYAAKVYLVVDSIFRKRNDGALIRFMTPLGAGASLDAAQKRLEGFAAAFLPEVAKALPE